MSSSRDTAHLETLFDGPARKTSPVLDPSKALFLDGTNQHTVSDQDCGHITVISVYPQNIHRVGDPVRYVLFRNDLICRFSFTEYGDHGLRERTESTHAQEANLLKSRFSE